MAEAAPGRFAFGLGASSEVIVERWNGIDYVDPYQRVRDTLRFLRAALAGEKVTADYDTFAVRGFPPGQPPGPSAAGLPGRAAGGDAAPGRPGGRRGRSSTGCRPTTWPPPLAEVGPGKEMVARIFVVPTDDAALARAVGRRMITAYLNVPAYAEFHRWLGRGPAPAGHVGGLGGGRPPGALAAIPDEVVDDLVVHGSPGACRDHIARYVANGVTVPALAVVPVGVDLAEAVQALAPTALSGPPDGACGGRRSGVRGTNRPWTSAGRRSTELARQVRAEGGVGPRGDRATRWPASKPSTRR